MNPWMLHAMADSHCREMRRDSAQRGGGGRHDGAALRPTPPTALAGHRWPRMRRQVGYALVEAGLRLLATAGPAQRG
jgi:hypothetical protein